MGGHEVFIPQSYDWGVEAQVDWYEAYADLDGERTKLQVFEMRSMASGGAFHRACTHTPRRRHFWKPMSWHMDAAYMDKLDGRISEGFRQRKQAELRAEELSIISLISGLETRKAVHGCSTFTKF